jgi:hypothetical protein
MSVRCGIQYYFGVISHVVCLSSQSDEIVADTLNYNTSPAMHGNITLPFRQTAALREGRIYIVLMTPRYGFRSGRDSFCSAYFSSAGTNAFWQEKCLRFPS